jgi:hypothetical protein
MAFRPPSRRNEREELVAYIHGIEADGEIAHILVHKRGANVRFSGRLGDHQVASSNRDDMEKWVSEAATVWGLDAAFGALRSWATAPDALEKMELLKLKAAERQKELGIEPAPEPQLGLTVAA